MLLRITVILLVAVLSTAFCEEEYLFDPVDPHSFNLPSLTARQGQQKLPKENFVDSYYDPDDPYGMNIPAPMTNDGAKIESGNIQAEMDTGSSSCTNKDTKNLQEELEICKRNQNKLMLSVLQRQTSMILEAVDLKTKADDSTYEKYFIVKLNQKDLIKLQNFAMSGNLDLIDLDQIWKGMLVAAENPDVLHWYHASYWKPDLTISRQTFIMFVAVGGVVTLILMLMMGVSLWRIVLIVLVLTFVFSATMRAFRMHQANVARLNSLRDKEAIKEMPSACRPFSRAYDERICAKFYDDGFTDPMTQIDVFDIVVMQFSETAVTMSKSFGTAFSVFFNSAFDDMPSWLGSFVRTVAKLAVLLIVVIISFLVFVWATPTLIIDSVKSTFQAITRGNPPEIPAVVGREQQAPIIVNVNLDSRDIISNELTPPRRLSEPAPPPSIEGAPRADSIRLRRLQSEPAFNASERLAPIADTNEALLSGEIESGGQMQHSLPDTKDQKQETEISDEISTPPASADASFNQENEPMLSNSGTPPSEKAPAEEVKSPLLAELKRLMEDENEQQNHVEE